MRRPRLLETGVLLALAVLVASSHLAWAHDSGFGLARYTPDGTLDATFGSGGVVVTRSSDRSLVANALALQPDGKILIAGLASDLPTASIQVALARFEPDGTPDTGFGANGVATMPVGGAGGEATALVVQPNGMVVLAGTAYAHGGAPDQFVLARFTREGRADPTFGSNGLTTTSAGAAGAGAQALVVQPDGKLLIAGTAFSDGATDDAFALVRYTSSGSLDRSFGSAGIVTTDFGTASLDRANALALQPDGRIVLAGATRGNQQAFTIVRYTSDGGLDPSFGQAGKVEVAAGEPHVHAVAIQSGGDVLVAGSTTPPGGRSSSPFAVLRLTTDGRPDESFGAGGVVTTSFEGSRSGARAVVAQPDGKLLAAGAKYGAPSAQGDALAQSGFALARYNGDGSIDSGFGTDGKTVTDMGDAGASPLSLVVQPDGKIVAAGLVFFQVPQTATPASPFAAALHLASPAAALALIGTACALGLLIRRRPR